MKRIRFYKWSCGTWTTIHHCANTETNTLIFDIARHYIDAIVIQFPYLIKIEKNEQKEIFCECAPPYCATGS